MLVISLCLPLSLLARTYHTHTDTPQRCDSVHKHKFKRIERKKFGAIAFQLNNQLLRGPRLARGVCVRMCGGVGNREMPYKMIENPCNGPPQSIKKARFQSTIFVQFIGISVQYLYCYVCEWLAGKLLVHFFFTLSARSVWLWFRWWTSSSNEYHRVNQSFLFQTTAFAFQIVSTGHRISFYAVVELNLNCLWITRS